MSIGSLITIPLIFWSGALLNTSADEPLSTQNTTNVRCKINEDFMQYFEANQSIIDCLAAEEFVRSKLVTTWKCCTPKQKGRLRQLWFVRMPPRGCGVLNISTAKHPNCSVVTAEIPAK